MSDASLMQCEYAYAKTIRSAAFAGARTELIFVNETEEPRIRFGAWKGGMLHRQALDVGETELLVLMGDAIAAGVISVRFVAEMRGILKGRSEAYDQCHDA